MISLKKDQISDLKNSFFVFFPLKVYPAQSIYRPDDTKEYNIQILNSEFRARSPKMGWIILIMLNIHIALGFLCAHMASDMRRRPEPWFFIGVLFGVMGLGLLMATALRRTAPGIR
jgi:hypothetical protein